MRRVPALLILVLVLVVVSLGSALRAQSTNASIAGLVTDPSKALIVDARVAAISADTNVRHETTTNSSGKYYVADLPPGPYRIEVEKPGFRKLIKPGVVLHVQDALAIDFEVTVGSVSDSITVTAGEPLLQTSGAV